MSLPFFRPPRDMADARATLTTPAIHNGHPAVIQDAWLFLAEARGLRVDLDRLHPAHLIDRPAPAVLTAAPALNEIDAARVAAIPLIRRIIGNRAPAPKGAA
jgi:hypothetical protein